MVKKKSIVEIAEDLVERRNKNKKTVLILGSQAGALYRSPQFCDEWSPLSKRNVDEMTPNQRFRECYSLLQSEKKRNGWRDLKNTLIQSIKPLHHDMADVSLATLVKQRLFNVLLTTNVDELLYHAFDAIEMKKQHDYIDFYFSRLPIQQTIQQIIEHEKLDACKTVRIYNDEQTFIYSIDQPTSQEEYRQGIYKLLERLRIDTLLLVGLDPAWDAILFTRLPPHIQTVYFVNEDEATALSYHDINFHVNSMYYTGSSYERFCKRLYEELNQDTPKPYEVLHEVLFRLRSQPGELKQLNDSYSNIHKDIQDIQLKLLQIIQHTDEIERRVTATHIRLDEVEQHVAAIHTRLEQFLTNTAIQELHADILSIRNYLTHLFTIMKSFDREQ